MISSVRGLLRGNSEQLVEIETPGGLGYELSVPTAVAAGLPALGREVDLFTHLIVRDGLSELYGFADRAQRALFRRLIGVGGIGPRSALALLSAFEPQEFFAAVIGGDSRALTRAQGIGPRSAKRIIAELQDRLAEAEVGSAAGAASPRVTAMAALQALSFSAAEAQELVRQAVEEGAGDNTDELVRRALRLAGSNK